MKQFQKIYLIQDRNNYWYAIPVEKISEFKIDDITQSLNNVSTIIDHNNSREWTRKYSQYMVGLNINNSWLDLYIEKTGVDMIDC
jgi:hypothetical protein